MASGQKAGQLSTDLVAVLIYLPRWQLVELDALAATRRGRSRTAVVREIFDAVLPGSACSGSITESAQDLTSLNVDRLT